MSQKVGMYSNPLAFLHISHYVNVKFRAKVDNDKNIHVYQCTAEK